MTRKGFTLIELLVVIVIIGILVAIALPNFIKIKDKAKEAEIKQNLHAIQLALERYATDSDGNYPYFLYGGDALFNIGVAYGLDDSQIPDSIVWGGRCVNPFDMFTIGLGDWHYGTAGMQDLIDGTVVATFGDTLEYEGYMPKYPGNPFAVGKTADQTFGLNGYQAWNFKDYTLWGGRDGSKMFNTGWLSEMPQLLMFTQPDNSPNNEFAGNFSYHARWSDDVTNLGHMVRQYADANQEAYAPGGTGALDDSGQVASLDVAGYDLLATGSPRTKGDDLDNSLSAGSSPHYFRTGYLTLGQERNPYVKDGDFNGTVQDFDERPRSDGVNDFTIIHLSSGLDKKSGNPQDDVN